MIAAASVAARRRTYVRGQPDLTLSADVTTRFENPRANDGLLQCGQTLPSPKS